MASVIISLSLTAKEVDLLEAQDANRSQAARQAIRAYYGGDDAEQGTTYVPEREEE